MVGIAPPPLISVSKTAMFFPPEASGAQSTSAGAVKRSHGDHEQADEAFKIIHEKCLYQYILLFIYNLAIE